MYSNNCVNPIVSSTSSTCKNGYYCNEKISSAGAVVHPHLHQAYTTLRKVKASFKTFLFEKRDHQAKRPQDGKTNPME